MSLGSLLLLHSLTYSHFVLSNNWGLGRIHYVETQTITEFLQSLPLPCVFGFANAFLARAQVAQNIFSPVSWCLYLLSVLCDMQNWTMRPTRNLSHTCAEELLPLQALGQPCKSGLFLWDRGVGILFSGLMFPADQLRLQMQQLTWGSFFPVFPSSQISHWEWKIRSKISAREQQSAQFERVSLCF